MQEQGDIETILLQYSNRGMDRLAPYLPGDYCRKAAEEILALREGFDGNLLNGTKFDEKAFRETIFLATGFYVAGAAETDGPLGTFVLGKALGQLGFQPVIVTDYHCQGFFEPEGLMVEYVPLKAGEEALLQLWERFAPMLLISIERCGRNQDGDYANMRGISISEETAPIDWLFEEAARREVPTIGIGDGGNEIGMGALAGQIEKELSLIPCTIPADHLILATVSNWGAYGLAAYLERLSGNALLPPVEEIERFLGNIVEAGSVDGVTKQRTATVDGFPQGREQEIAGKLAMAAKQHPPA